MMLITDYGSIVFVLMVWQTDANLKIVETGTRAGTSSFECGTKLVLTCQIDAYSLSMSWQNDSSSTPLAECIPSSCDLDPDLVGLYEFSTDTSVGIFNLTINKLTLENNGSTYRCGHDLTFNSSLVIVKDYEPTLNEVTPDKIEVISGCINNNTEVEYFWEKVKKKANLNKESNYEDFKPQNITNSSNMCSGDTNCEPNHFVKRSCLIGIKPGGEDDYLIRAVLSYDGFVVKSALTNGTYKIYDGGSHCNIKCDTVCRLLIGIGVCLITAVIVGCLLLYVMLILCSTKKGDCTTDKRETLHIEIILNIVSAIMWIVIVILFICSLLHCYSCDDPCCCCKIVLILLYIIGALFGIHVFLWLLLLYVLYKRKKKDDEEGNIYCKTKLMKVRIASSTIPMVGFFPVCGWLIRIYRYENRTIHDRQVTSEKKLRELPSIPKRIHTINKTEDKRNNSQTKAKKEHVKIDQFFKQTIDSSKDREEKMKEDQLSASEITIVKPKGTDIKSNANIQKSPDAISALTHSVTQQLSQDNRTALTRSQGHNEKHENNMPDKQNHSPHSDENPQRKINVTNKQSGSEKKSDSKDEVKPKKRKSRKETDGNKSTKTSEFAITDAQTGNTQVTTTGSDPPDSGDDDSPLDISKSDKAASNRIKSKKNKKNKEGVNNTKPTSAESHNGSETKKRALSANFDDKYDVTTTVSINSDTNM